MHEIRLNYVVVLHEPSYENDKRQGLFLRQAQIIVKTTCSPMVGNFGIMICENEVVMPCAQLCAG